MLAKRLIVGLCLVGALGAWGRDRVALCQLTMEQFSDLLHSTKGLQTGLPRGKLQEIINKSVPPHGSEARAAMQYRNARDFVVDLPPFVFADATFAIRSAYLDDLFTEIYLDAHDTDWAFTRYAAPDGSLVFEGPGMAHPVVVIRRSDGEVFKGVRPDEIASPDWKPDFTKLTQLHPSKK